MHLSRQYLQQLEKQARKADRQLAADEAKKAGSNKIRKTSAVNYLHRRHAKSYEMGS